MNWSYRYPALTHWGDESTTHVTLHLCGFLLVCDQSVCFLRLYKLVDKGQYFCLYSLHCCTLQMAPWIFLTCYTRFGLCLHFSFDVFVFLFERLPAVGFNKFVYLTVDNCEREKNKTKQNQWLNSGARFIHREPLPTWYWIAVSMLWKIIQMVQDPQTSNMDVDFPLTNLKAFGS